MYKHRKCLTQAQRLVLCAADVADITADREREIVDRLNRIEREDAIARAASLVGFAAYHEPDKARAEELDRLCLILQRLAR